MYPDTLITRSYVMHVGTTSFTMLYEVVSEQQQQMVALGKSVIVIVTPEIFEKQAIPNHVKAQLLSYMKNFKY